jgi:hypothetical protein
MFFFSRLQADFSGASMGLSPTEHIESRLKPAAEISEQLCPPPEGGGKQHLKSG